MQTISPRRTIRISIDKPSQRPEPEISALPVEVGGSTLSRVDEPASDTPDLKSELLGVGSLAFQKLASKSPALLDLVAALDLVEVSSTIIKPEPLPPLVERMPTEPVNSKLVAIAQLAFLPCRAYTESDAINRLASITAVSTDRARNGITLMYAQCILSLTLSNEYYLTETTPF